MSALTWRHGVRRVIVAVASLGLIAAGFIGCSAPTPANERGVGDTSSVQTQLITAEDQDADVTVEAGVALDTVPAVLTLSFRGRGPYRELQAVRITIGQGESARHLTGADFNVTRPGDRALRSTARLYLPSSGRLPIHVVLLDGTLDTIGLVTTDLNLRPGYAYGVRIVAGWPRPAASYCGGKEFDRVSPLRRVARSVELRPGEHGPPLIDSLFLSVSAIDQGSTGLC